MRIINLKRKYERVRILSDPQLSLKRSIKSAIADAAEG